MSTPARRLAPHRRPRMTVKMAYEDATYKQLLNTMIRTVSDFSRIEKKRLMLDAHVFSWTPEAVNWDLLRREVERVLKIDLVPVTHAYFDDRVRRRRKQADLLSSLKGEDARRYLAHNCTPAGYISATSPDDQDIVQAGLDFMRKVAHGVTHRANDVSQKVIEAAEVRRLAALPPPKKKSA